MENEPIRVLHIVPNMQAGGLETLIMNIYRNIDICLHDMCGPSCDFCVTI